MERNIFELATRQAVRFETNRGLITTEHLWDMPLIAKGGYDLDTVAKGVNAQLKAVSEESFVATRVNPAKADHELRLEVVKHVIAVKLAEQEDRAKAAARAQERAKLLQLLDKKQDAEMEAMTPEQIQKRLAELGV